MFMSLYLLVAKVAPYIFPTVIALLAVGLVFFRPFVIGLAIKLYGRFTKEELKKYVTLALIFCLTIGVYWLLRPTKDGFFCKMAGASNIPLAKMASLFFIFPLVILYSKLVDMFPRHKVFYALCAIYGTIALVFAYFMFSPVYGVENLGKVALSNGIMEDRHNLAIGRFLGWAWYLFVESFGSIIVALFWSFTADTTTPESAKKGYGLIALGGQLGGIFGPYFVFKYAKTWGLGWMALIAGLGIFTIALSIKLFMTIIPQDELTGYQAKDETKEQKKHEKAKTGFFEGLKLLVSQPYLLCIFASISLYEIIVTIFDFHMKTMANSSLEGSGALTAYLGEFGFWTNLMSFACLILGINSIGRKLGLTIALVSLPVIIAGLVGVLWLSPTLPVVFWIMVLSKGINYALYQPTKEQLYIPTTKDTKYKAKAWTEMFGSRSSKAGGSVVNLLNKFMEPSMFIMISSILSLGLVGVWIACALYLGRTHKKAVSENKVVC